MAKVHGVQVADSDLIGQVISVSPKRIRRFEDQPRKNFNKKKLEGLATSIATVGLKKPIKIMPVNGDSDHEFELVDGERRWLACGMANVNTKAWVVPTRSKEEQYEESVIDNMISERHTDLEYAYAIDRMMNSKKLSHLNAGERLTHVARALDMHETTVHAYRGLLRLDPEVQEYMSEERDEEDRLGGALAKFISGLHPEIQKEVARVSIEKRLTVNQARVLARELAEKDGQIAGAGKEHRAPRRDYSVLRNFTKRIKNDLSVLLAPIVLASVRKRGTKDMEFMAGEIEACIREMQRLKSELLVSTFPSRVSSATAESVPSQSFASSQKLAQPPTPPTKQSVQPSSGAMPSAHSQDSVGNGDGRKTQQPDFNLFSSIFSILFYSQTMTRRVNLGRKHLAKNLPGVIDLDYAVKQAVDSARKCWRQPMTGENSEQKFRRIVARFRHDFGDPTVIDEAITRAMKEDQSSDPVAL